jgi:hypothetical protein
LSSPAISYAAARAPARARDVAAGGAVALVVAAAARTYGSYDISAWGPLGLLLTGCVGGLLAAGRRPGRRVTVAALAFAALGGWALASTAWGGLPHEAWRALDLSLVSAAALLLGSLLAGTTRSARIVFAGALVGAVSISVEVLARGATGTLPSAWFYGRLLEGPVGHHNAQAALGAAALPLAIAAATSRAAWIRAGGMASAGLLVAVILLTQSRAALAAVAAAAAAQILWSRSVEVALRIALLVPAVLVLVPPLQDVDAALSAGPAAATAPLRSFAFVAGIVALTLAATGLVRARFVLRRRSIVAIAGVAAVAAVIVGLTVAPVRGLPTRAHASLVADPRDAPPGSTRFASFGLNGRRDAWRVAAAIVRHDPILGAGQGQFARWWARDRHLGDLYILQPHSLELEILSELGPVGALLFTVAIGSIFAGLAGRSRRVPGAAAGAALVALLVHASLDWVWSFPGIVAPFLLVAGAAVGGGRMTRPTRPRAAAIAAAALVVSSALALPYLADAELTRGSRLLERDPARARMHLHVAHLLYPWNADGFSAEGRLAEIEGRFPDAAVDYAAAAPLSQRPWLAYYREARAFRRAGQTVASRAACRRAVSSNPKEPLLRSSCR